MHRTENAIDCGYSEYELLKAAKVLPNLQNGQRMDMGKKHVKLLVSQVVTRVPSQKIPAAIYGAKGAWGRAEQ